MDKIDYDKLLQIRTGGQGVQIHTDWEAKLMMKEAVKQAIDITLHKAKEHAIKCMKDDMDITLTGHSIIDLKEELIKNMIQ